MSKNYKILIWHLAVAVFSFWMWSYSSSVSFNGVTGLNFNLMAGLSFILLTTTVVVGYMIFSARRLALSVSTIVGLSFMAFLGFSWLNFLAVIGFYLFNLYAATHIKGEMIGRVKLNIRTALMAGLYPVIIGLFLMISFAAYQSQLAKDIESTQKLPSQVQTFFHQISSQMYSNKIEGTPKQKQAIFNQVATEAYSAVNNFFRPYFRYAPPLLSFALFLLLFGLSWIFAWLGVAIGLMLFWVLKKTRMVRIEERDVRAQVLVV